MLKFIVFSWALSLGFVTMQSDVVGDNIAEIDGSKYATFTSIDLSGTVLDRVRFYTTIETYQYANKNEVYFYPYRANYISGVDVYLSDMVSIGAIHECDHPVESKYNLATGEMSSWYNYVSQETRIFIKIGSDVK
jgi:hypothetical protein